MDAQLASKAKTEAKLRALLHRIKTDTATTGDLEATRQFLAGHDYKMVSGALFRLADAARAHINKE
jgi:hypothetical protein